YLFDYNEEQLDKLILEKLKLWPTNKQIIQTIYHLYHLACELSESLDEVSTSYIYNDTNLADI
ncbi:17840_t:CDS:2, partial [Cetraspora pellucida]